MCGEINQLTPKVTFFLPPYFSGGGRNTSFESVQPVYDKLLELESQVIHLYSKQKLSKREARQERRYLVYDRPPEGKKKKKQRKCPSSNGISAFTFLNFAMGAMSLAANVVNNINSNNNNNNNNK